jgi:GTPase
LTKGKLDDGRGRARVSLFRHKHELDSGRTSSVGMEIMGCTLPIKYFGFLPRAAIWLRRAIQHNDSLHAVVDAKGREVRPEGTAELLTASNQVGLRKQQLSWDDICKKAAKVVSFIDLAGHERYLKVGHPLHPSLKSTE